MKFEKNAKYSFYEDPFTRYEFIEYAGDGARFVEYRLEPSDGSLEEIGPIEFDAYQITRLQQIRDESGTYYILRDMDGYGNAAPVCVTRESAEELMRGWYAMDENALEFNEVWREADADDIAEYGTEDE